MPWAIHAQPAQSFPIFRKQVNNLSGSRSFQPWIYPNNNQSKSRIYRSFHYSNGANRGSVASSCPLSIERGDNPNSQIVRGSISDRIDSIQFNGLNIRDRISISNIPVFKLCVAVAQIFQVTNFAQSQRKEKAAQVKKRDNPLSTLCIAIKEQNKTPHNSVPQNKR